MKYRNVRTGAIIDMQSELKGDDWEPVVAEPVKEAPKATKQKGKAKK